MTDATLVSISRQPAAFTLDRFLDLLARLAMLDPTRRALCHLSDMSDREIAARGTSREAMVRRIIGPRGML